MNYAIEQVRSAYKNLSDDERYLVTDNETTDLISAAIQESGLSGEQADQADSEILYAMYGLQTLDDAIKNIATLSQKPVESLNSLKTKLRENVFDKLEEIKKTSVPRKEAESAQTASNLPMVEPGEVVHEVPRQSTTNNPRPTTENKELPATQQKPPPAIHYPGGIDPYREPLD